MSPWSVINFCELFLRRVYVHAYTYCGLKSLNHTVSGSINVQMGPDMIGIIYMLT